MTKTCNRRGVPQCLRQDGWWLGPITPARRTPSQMRIVQTPRRYALHALLLAGLIAVAQVPGLSDAPEMQPNTITATCTDDNFLHFRATKAFLSLAVSPQQGASL